MKKKISKKTKVISLILSLVLVLGTVLSVSIFSSFAESFTDENGIEWTVIDCYPGWAIEPTDKSQIVGDITIPDKYKDKLVVSIGDNSDNTNNAFSNCTGLTSVTIPDSVGSIGYSAFKGCSNLNSIEFGNGITYISDKAFYDCSNLTGELVIPNGVTYIGEDAFNSCIGLTSVTIPNSVTEIGDSAFRGCTGLTSVTIPDSVTYIGRDTFRGCTGLTSLDLGNGVTTIGNSAFTGCTGLTSVTIPDSVTEIGEYAFQNCSGITSITIPDSMTEINPNAFYKCTGLTSVTIPDSVTEIGDSAFRGCTGLTNIALPDSITKIGGWAFYDCTSLTSVTIPDDVIIGSGAFPSKLKISSNITTITFTDENGISWKATDFLTYLSIKPADKTQMVGDITIPAEHDGKPILAIDDSAFSNCTGLTSITIPDSVTEIGDSAFRGCTGLTSLDLGNGVTTIGNSAYENCTSLTIKLVIPNSVTYIGEEAFMSCIGLTSVTIPNSVTEIGDSAFCGCTGLTSITIPNSITKINDNTFKSCTGLTSVTIPDSVTYIGEDAFGYCRGLTSVTIPDSVIYLNGFRSCHNLTNVVIPDSVKFIGDNAFLYCYEAFNSITIGKNVECVGVSAFGELGELDALTIETSNTSNIHITAFYNDYFNNLVVTDTVKEIDSVLLSGNKNFTNVSLGSNITNITNDAFYGNSNMTISTTKDATKVIKFASANNIPVNIVDNVDTTRTVDFEVTCDKTDYEFTVYRVADLEQSTMPYEVRYDSLITDIEDEIFEGDSEALLNALDAVDSSLLTEVVGTYSTNVDGASKLFEDLPAGIYYVRATNFPANVYSVQNSVFALPYYDSENDKWVYEIDPIPLATKVDESDPEIVKSITNSTQDNVNFTDVSLGDTVEFKIKSSRVGSANSVESLDFKLNSYVVSDIMESGLTLNQDSFVVTLEDVDGNTAATLDPATDYVVDITAEDGKDTTFTVSLTDTYLQEGEFYSDYSRYLAISYSAVLNEYSTREFDGNYNTATDLTWTNKTNVEATVEGNTVYAYTYGIEVNKYDDAGTPLAGSVFDLYLTKADAQAQTGSIATGTSDENGNVVFYTADGDVAKLQSGEYFIIETKATEGYNRYTDVIPVTISVEYGETEVNGTYIESAPENGVQLVEVKNSKVIIPNTGGNGAMYRYIIALAFLSLAITFVVLKKRENKKAKN